MHYVLVQWYNVVVKPNSKGETFLVVYADDFITGFQYEWEAKAYYEALKLRMAKFGLSLEFTMKMDKLGYWTPLIFEITVNDMSVPANFILDNLIITDVTDQIELINVDFEGVKNPQTETPVYPFVGYEMVEQEYGTQIKLPSDIDSPTVLDSMMFKFNGRNDAYTGQLMNINEGKVGSQFVEGHSYKFQVRVYSENVRDLIFRSTLLQTNDGVNKILIYNTYTLQTDANGETNATDISIVKDGNFQLVTFTFSMDKVGYWTPLLFEATLNDKDAPAIYLIDEISVTDITNNTIVLSETFENIIDIRNQTVVYPFDGFDWSLTDSSKLVKESKFDSLMFKFSGRTDAYTGQFMNINEGKVGSQFVEGHSYKFQVRVYSENVRDLIFRSTLLQTNDGVNKILIYNTYTLQTDANGETNATDISIVKDGNFQLVTFTFSMDKVGYWTPLLFEATINDVKLPATYLIDEIKITDVTNNSVVVDEDFEFINDVRSETVVYPFDGWTWNLTDSSKIVKESKLDSLMFKFSGRTDAYTGQFMNVNELKVGTSFIEGHSYKFQFRVYSENIRDLIFRSTLLQTNDGVNKILIYNTYTLQTDSNGETNATDISIVQDGKYQLVTFTFSMDKVGYWTPLLFEATINDVKLPATYLIDEIKITDVTNNSVVVDEDFEFINDVRSETVVYPFDGWTWNLVDKKSIINEEPQTKVCEVFKGLEQLTVGNTTVKLIFSLKDVNDLRLAINGCQETEVLIKNGKMTGADGSLSLSGGKYTLILNLSVIDVEKFSIDYYASMLLESNITFYEINLIKENKHISDRIVKYEDTIESKNYDINETIIDEIVSGSGIYNDINYVYYYKFVANMSSILINNEEINLTHGTYKNVNISMVDNDIVLQIVLKEGDTLNVKAVTSGVLTLKEHFIIETNNFINVESIRGEKVYSQNFENGWTNTFGGYDYYAQDGITGNLTFDKELVISGKSSVLGGFNYRKESVTWARLFGIDQDAFKIDPLTQYTVSFKYKIIEDPFMQAGEFYFIFNSDSAVNDCYWGFNSLGPTSFNSGVTSWKIDEYEDYSVASFTVITKDAKYNNALFGIHLGGKIVVDDFIIYKENVLPVGNSNVMSDYTITTGDELKIDFKNDTLFSLGSASQYSGTLKKDEDINYVQIKSTGDWAEGLIINYDFKGNSIYTISFDYNLYDGKDAYILLRSPSIENDEHCFIAFDNDKIKAYFSDNKMFMNNMFDGTVTLTEDGIYHAEIKVINPNIDDIKLIFGVYGNGKLDIYNVNITENIYMMGE